MGEPLIRNGWKFRRLSAARGFHREIMGIIGIAADKFAGEVHVEAGRLFYKFLKSESYTLRIKSCKNIDRVN